jgi:hypothetical protein
MIVARLNDVRADGSVAKVATGLLNLTHRDGDEHPQPLEPGRWYPVTVQLSAAGYRFPAGHRIRIALSPSYWPLAWPTPTRVRLRIGGDCRLTLPERRAAHDGEVVFGPPEAAPGPELVNLRAGREYAREVVFDVAANTVTRRVVGGVGAYGGEGLNLYPDSGLAFEYDVERRQTIALDDPASAVAEFDQRMTVQRGEWNVAVVTSVRVASTVEELELAVTVEVSEQGERVLGREWRPRFRRDSL